PRWWSVNLVDIAAGIALLLALGVLLMWPLFDVFAAGLLTMPPPFVVVRNTLAVAGAAPLGALGLAAVVATAARVGAPGREALIALGRAGVFVPPFVVPLAVLALAGRDRVGLAALA